MDTTNRFEFLSPVLRQEGGMRFHYLPVPDDIAKELLALGSARILMTINGRTFRRAIQSSATSPSIIVGMPILKEVGAVEGDNIAVVIEPDPEPNKIDMAEEFVEVLRQDKEAARRFYAMTPGMQRSLAYYVTSAKRVDTRIKRALELARKLRTRTLNSDL